MINKHICWTVCVRMCSVPGPHRDWMGMTPSPGGGKGNERGAGQGTGKSNVTFTVQYF